LKEYFVNSSTSILAQLSQSDCAAAKAGESKLSGPLPLFPWHEIPARARARTHTPFQFGDRTPYIEPQTQGQAAAGQTKALINACKP
jgi:hypothetical protein